MIRNKRIKKFLHFIWKERKISIFVFFISFILPLAHLPLPLLLKKTIDVLAYQPKIREIFYWLIWLGVGYFILHISNGLRSYFTQKYKEKTSLRFKNWFFTHFLNLEIGYFSDQGSGYFVQRLNETDDLKNLLVDQFGNAIGAFTLMGISFFVLCWLNVITALIFLAYVPIQIFIILKMQRNVIERSRDVRETQSIFIGKTQEYLSNVEKIRAFGIEGQIIEKFNKAAQTIYTAIIRHVKLQVIWNTRLECSSLPFFILSFIVLGHSIIRGENTVGDLMAVSQFGTYFLSNVLQLGSIIQQIFISLPSFERVFDILESEPIVKNGKIGLDSIDRFDIKVENVFFKYPKREVYALNGISFEIKEGEKVSLVGPSGSGKSTILKLLLRLYEPQEGSLSIGGVPIRDIKFEAIRKFVKYIPQEPFLLNATAIENIEVFVPDKKRDEIIKILKSIGLDEVFNSLPKGYYTNVYEMGTKISGGQRQIIGLARIFLTDPKIILLDEPTSSQDPLLEKLMMEYFQKFVKGRTSIIIAHRPSTILTSDRILMIENGKITQSGTHKFLLEHNKVYRAYFEELQCASKDN